MSNIFNALPTHQTSFASKYEPCALLYHHSFLFFYQRVMGDEHLVMIALFDRCMEMSIFILFDPTFPVIQPIPTYHISTINQFVVNHVDFVT